MKPGRKPKYDYSKTKGVSIKVPEVRYDHYKKILNIKVNEEETRILQCNCEICDCGAKNK